MRANASVVAVLIILLVIGGVIYLFWQNTQVSTENPTTSTVESSIETTVSDPIDEE